MAFCAISCVVPHVVYVTMCQLQLYMNNQDFGAALVPYGRVISIEYPNFSIRRRIKNRARLGHIEMTTPIPHFLPAHG